MKGEEGRCEIPLHELNFHAVSSVHHPRFYRIASFVKLIASRQNLGEDTRSHTTDIFIFKKENGEEEVEPSGIKKVKPKICRK